MIIRITIIVKGFFPFSLILEKTKNQDIPTGTNSFDDISDINLIFMGNLSLYENIIVTISIFEYIF